MKAGARVLITGGTGFLGRALAQRIPEAVVVGRRAYDLTDWEDTRDLFCRLPLDYILHCADVHGNAQWSQQHQGEQYLQNTAITVNVLKAWHCCQPQARFVALGSAWAYPAVSHAVREEEYWDGPLHPPVRAYGLGKRLQSLGLSTLKQQYGLKGTTLILGNVYGPGDRSARLIPSLIRQMQADVPEITLWSDGKERRPFIYVDDQITGILQHLDYDGEVLNVGPPTCPTVREVTECLARQLVYPYAHLSYGDQSAPGCVFDHTRAQDATGWPDFHTFTTLAAGLRATVAAVSA
jgi:GDP-L-fucose synthase